MFPLMPSTAGKSIRMPGIAARSAFRPSNMRPARTPPREHSMKMGMLCLSMLLTREGIMNYLTYIIRKMISRRVDVEEAYVGRFDHDSEGVQELKDLVSKLGVKSGVFTVIGSVMSATLAYYDQESREYVEYEVDRPMEIANCSGNVSVSEGMPHIHAHICLSDREGNTVSGHLVDMRVFAAELYLRKFRSKVDRVHDETTGLQLMDLR
ncbi:MAG: DUF296 domain-containing protein [Candidatus Altiarchaeales archaeon]|nr:DUF296 domain-containing protein [Candidatus Altiarchaeales archaeon]MBD3416576.1 DUF296 domain-containing protein [Candidatus Altiarchaeales archaeon]